MNFNAAMICDAALTARSKDGNGFLSVSRSNLAKANVRKYYGRELEQYLPDLEPNKAYYFYTPREEIEKAVESVKGKPLLLLHKWLKPNEIPDGMVVGSVGSDVGMDGDYLYGDLYINKAEGIAAVEDGTCSDISAGYRLVPIMQPGITDSGQPYDGIFTNLEFNHIALVPVGRTGEGVKVADEKPKEIITMLKINKKRLASNLKASCFGIFDQNPDYENLVAAVAKDKVPAEKMAQGITDSLSVIAGDSPAAATLKDGRILAAVMDAEEDEAKVKDEDGEAKAKDEDGDKEKAKASDDTGKTVADIMKFIKSNMSERDHKLVTDFIGGAADCAPDTGKAMDAAPVMDEATIKKIVDAAQKDAFKKFQGVTAAREKVLKYGHSATVMDSAPNVFREALGDMGVNIDGFDDCMLERVFDQEMKLRERYNQNAAAGVMDAAAPANQSASLVDDVFKELGISK